LGFKILHTVKMANQNYMAEIANLREHLQITIDREKTWGVMCMARNILRQQLSLQKAQLVTLIGRMNHATFRSLCRRLEDVKIRAIERFLHYYSIYPQEIIDALTRLQIWELRNPDTWPPALRHALYIDQIMPILYMRDASSISRAQSSSRVEVASRETGDDLERTTTTSTNAQRGSKTPDVQITRTFPAPPEVQTVHETGNDQVNSVAIPTSSENAQLVSDTQNARLKWNKSLTSAGLQSVHETRKAQNTRTPTKTKLQSVQDAGNIHCSKCNRALDTSPVMKPGTAESSNLAENNKVPDNPTSTQPTDKTSGPPKPPNRKLRKRRERRDRQRTQKKIELEKASRPTIGVQPMSNTQNSQILQHTSPKVDKEHNQKKSKKNL
jgi:hypothetical protein